MYTNAGNMLKEKIDALQGTKTIIYMDNINHNSIIVPYLTENLNRSELYAKYKDLCVYLEDKKFNFVSDIDYYNRAYSSYKNYKFIKSSDLIGDNIYECW
jgi:hypothetical protein